MTYVLITTLLVAISGLVVLVRRSFREMEKRDASLRGSREQGRYADDRAWARRGLEADQGLEADRRERREKLQTYFATLESVGVTIITNPTDEECERWEKEWDEQDKTPTRH